MPEDRAEAQTKLRELGVELPERPSYNPWAASTKREFWYGARARVRGVEQKYNPWARSRGGRAYHSFEFWWNRGWNLTDEMIKEKANA